MTREEREWLNHYHSRVREELMSLLDDEADRQWLIAATEAIR
jgi:Xaa-Pro aminopeptidase